jgi:hypothetical protein
LNVLIADQEASVVPEPATFGRLALGLSGLVATLRPRAKACSREPPYVV